MSRVEVTQETTTLSDGILKTDLPLDGTLQVVKDQLNNSSTLLLATDETQVNSVLRINTDTSELLDLQDTGSNNRFNINRDVQKINLDFASKPSDVTTQVGAIRTAIDGTNLSDAVKFQENGQVTFTERVKVESDSTVTTQTSSVVQASTTNASLVLAPNGTGAILASVPDGTVVGGNARGANAIDLQMLRSSAANVASGTKSITIGEDNRSTSQNSISIGLSNIVTARYSQAHGRSCNASGEDSFVYGVDSSVTSTYCLAGGVSSSAQASGAIALGYTSTAAGIKSMAVNSGKTESGTTFTFASGDKSNAYLYGQVAFSSGGFSTSSNKAIQSSLLTARRDTSILSGGTMVLSLDGTGVTNLIIPLTGSFQNDNRAWNVTCSWVAAVTAITGTATGISVGDVITSVDFLAFKRLSGTSSVSTHTPTAIKTMVTTPVQYTSSAMAYTVGSSQEMALTFTGPTFVGGGTVTMRIIARIELSEIGW